MSSQEQPEDQSADDQPESAESDPAGPDQADQAKEPTEDERLEELGEHIDKARAHAEDAGVIDDPDQEEYVDSGATPAQDDQTITPPG